MELNPLLSSPTIDPWEDNVEMKLIGYNHSRNLHRNIEELKVYLPSMITEQKPKEDFKNYSKSVKTTIHINRKMKEDIHQNVLGIQNEKLIANIKYMNKIKVISHQIILNIIVSTINSFYLFRLINNDTNTDQNQQTILERCLSFNDYNALYYVVGSIFGSLMTIVLMINIFQKYKLQLIYEKSQGATIRHLIVSKTVLMVIEELITLPHPLFFLGESQFTIPFYYPIEANEILFTLQFIRILILFEAVFYFNNINEPFVQQIYKIFKSIQQNFGFTSIKLFLRINPFLISIILFIVCLLVSSCLLYCAESKLLELNNRTLITYEDCLYYILLVMFFIGYDELSPMTLYGKLIILGTLIISGICLCILLISFFNSLHLNQNEQRLLSLIQRLKLKEEFNKVTKEIMQLSLYQSVLSRKYIIEKYHIEQSNSKALDKKLKLIDKKVEECKRKIVKNILKRNELNKKMMNISYTFFNDEKNTGELNSMISLLQDTNTHFDQEINKMITYQKNIENDIELLRKSLD